MKSTKDPEYTFWLNNITILYKNDKYLDFVPNSKMTRVEQLNALSRFCFYLIFLFFIFGKGSTYYYFPIIGLIFIIVIYLLYNGDIKGKETELERGVHEIVDDNNDNFDGSIKKEEYDINSQNPFIDNTQMEKTKKDIIIESGYYDSNGNISIGPYFSHDTVQSNKTNYSIDEIKRYNEATCRKPTRDNPFMNPNLTNFNNGDQPVPCNADDDQIKDHIDDKYNMDLYRDIDDLFDIKNSQRQFFTVPNASIPPDQPAFANWCFKNKGNCKTDQQMCLRYEDLRYASPDTLNNHA
jgi:hypothetical protein